MSLGPKKRAALVEQANKEFWKAEHDWLGAVVAFMLAREEARVKPLLEELVHVNAVFECNGFHLSAKRVRDFIAADAAAQADEPEPTLAEAAAAVAAEIERCPDGIVYQRVPKSVLDTLRSALAREKESRR